MKINTRILTSVLTIGTAGALLVGATFAYFNSTATVSGITINTGNALLKINDATSLNNPINASGLYPGWQQGVAFKLSNSSTADIGLDVTAQLTSPAVGDWAVLSGVVNVAVVEYSTQADAIASVGANDPTHQGVTANTGWQTLAVWNSSPISIGTTIAHSTDHYLVLWGMIPTSAGNEISGKTLIVNFDLVGTQHH